MNTTDIESAEALRIAEIVAQKVHAAVREAIDAPDAGEAAGVASSGDTTFSVDIVAEAALERALLELDVPVACYSEDQGLQAISDNPKWLLIVDPIDGTRSAAAGLDACVVSVAVSRLNDEPRFKDVVAGAVFELRRDRVYLARRGNGAREITPSGSRDMSPHPPKEFCELRWTLETVARPALYNYMAAQELIDETSLRGGLFALNSSAYALCQVAAGRFSGMVDLSARILRDCDPGETYMRKVGHGRVMGLWAYDIAAAALIALEAGCQVTDAWGKPLDEMILTRTRPEDMASCICGPCSEYHARMLDLLDQGFETCKAFSLE